MMDEHQAIRAHIEFLRRAREIDPSLLAKSQDVAGAERNLQLALSFLAEGIQRHYSHEEQVMPPLFGELLMKAIIVEHRQIQAQLDRVTSLINDAVQKAGLQQNISSENQAIRLIIEEVCQKIETHGLIEDAIFTLLKNVV